MPHIVCTDVCGQECIPFICKFFTCVLFWYSSVKIRHGVLCPCEIVSYHTWLLWCWQSCCTLLATKHSQKAYLYVVSVCVCVSVYARMCALRLAEGIIECVHVMITFISRQRPIKVVTLGYIFTPFGFSTLCSRYDIQTNKHTRQTWQKSV